MDDDGVRWYDVVFFLLWIPLWYSIGVFLWFVLTLK